MKTMESAVICNTLKQIWLKLCWFLFCGLIFNCFTNFFLLQNFKDFVVGHFISHVHYIMVAGNAYIEGAQVGCLVKGGVQDVDDGDKSSSRQFKNSLAGHINVAALNFTGIGSMLVQASDQNIRVYWLNVCKRLSKSL